MKSKIKVILAALGILVMIPAMISDFGSMTVCAQEAIEEPADPDHMVKVTIPESELSEETIEFETVTLDNENVTQDIFSDYDLTVVHVWGTFCGPCIREMGDYGAWYKELPDNVNLVGVMCDVYDGMDSNVSDARDILKSASAEFTNLRTSMDLYAITSVFQYVPSSFFVDREGHIVGIMMDGAGFEETKERLYGYLDQTASEGK